MISFEVSSKVALQPELSSKNSGSSPKAFPWNQAGWSLTLLQGRGGAGGDVWLGQRSIYSRDHSPHLRALSVSQQGRSQPAPLWSRSNLMVKATAPPPGLDASCCGLPWAPSCGLSEDAAQKRLGYP